MNKLNTPNWNLDSIYPSITSEKFLSDVKKLKTGTYELSKFIMDKSSYDTKEKTIEWIAKYFNLDDTLAPIANTLSAYSYSIYSTNTTNKSFLDNLNSIEILIDNYHNESKKFSQIISENKNLLQDFFSLHPEYKKYEFFINECIEESKHLLSPSEEKIISTLQQTGGKAWDRLHEQLISNLKDEQSKKLFNELRNDAYSPDPQLRKTSWQKEIILLKQNQIAFAACLNNLKGETTSLLKERNWDNSIQRALFNSRIKKETLDALIYAIEDSLPDWQKYLCAKAEYLKKNNLTESSSSDSKNGIAFYDLFAPLDSPKSSNTLSNENSEQSILSKEWTFDEAKNYIINEFNSFSSRMGDFAKKAFENNWIDATVHPGKVGGAYCQDFYLQKESRVLSNFTGTFSDIITLAHELGHAFHFDCIKNKDYRNAIYPMTLAETASTFAETIVKQNILQTASTSDKLKILELDLQDTCQVLVDILCRFYFERSVFEERKNGELTAEDFCRLMKDAQEKSYGKGLNSERHEYMWAVKSHYYSTELDFYNYPYAFGQLFAAALFERFKNEGTSFVQTYCSLLENTGSMSCEELCLKAGFDITKKEFWESGIQMYKKEIAKFCKLI